MGDTVFLTGATGFLGTELAKRFASISETKLYVLVRASGEEEAYHRLREAWFHDRDLYDTIGRSAFPICGDFTEPQLDLDPADRERLKREVTLVVHAGAEVGFQKSREELFRTNVTGTAQMLLFSEALRCLRRFVFISTAYVAGLKQGLILEENASEEGFASYYEESKAKAEAMVRSSGLPYSIARPGMIVGHSETGWIRNFNTVYYALKLLLKGELRVLPMKAGTPVPIITVDEVADEILAVCCEEEAEGQIFHMTCPDEMAPTVGELVSYTISWAKENLSVSVREPAYIPLSALKAAGISHNRKEAGSKKGYLNNLLTIMPYFFGGQTFDRSHTDALRCDWDKDWHSFIDTLLAFACRKNFMRQTGRTVFEQAMERRESSRYPIFYYDVTSSGIRRVPGKTVNERIRKAVNALYGAGVRKGDRVAITGINSVAYLVLEQAIGLIGAVSVPIYYTSPAEETSLLLERSGSKWFFIGDTRMMDQVDAIRTDARMVSFSKGQEVYRKGVMRWGQFLKLAQGEAEFVGPDPEDLATIRYTSGTTGEPKGVMFNFAQLTWMGEVMTNLISFEDRNRTLRYLSFLPLSHVVEGILTSYAPYYLLARVEYFYLNDFSALTEALPKVRPTVFFSVPRFYEKVWESLSANPLGQRYLAAEDGPLKKAEGLILKKAALKKAGIDRCRQLIVGSAPVSEHLLLTFRELGIEIHNAYGQTEAPLITINRLGDNVIPTIGTALPETEISVEADGELIVRGPQVSLGYYGLKTDTLRDGVLRTGDLGRMDENGHVTLVGRKKDMIITAYGKNISIPKIEERLKDIPGVTEAVLIGENRPYCTALLWLAEDLPSLDAAIESVNENLSHPEKIRRYCVIERTLSIQEGELTPNLKVKRANVETHFAQEIENMYKS